MDTLNKIIKKLVHHSLTVTLLLGFVIDSIILPEIESVHTRQIGLFYLSIVALSILLREYVVSRNRATKTEGLLHAIFSYGIAFFSGSLLSFIVIYFFRSASLLVSWPLFIFLLLIIILNETFVTKHFRFLLDISLFFISQTFFVLFMLPIFLKKQSDEIFLMSLGVSFIVSLLYINLLKYFSEAMNDLIRDAYKTALAIPAVIFTFYFLNVIPPVPLSTKSANIYHSVTKNENGNYSVIGEQKTFWDFLKTKKFHYMEGEKIYFFSAISAPSGLHANLSHVWEKYDKQTNKWQTKLVLPYSLVGGRDGGYRSYSMLENFSEGEWRVSAKVGERRTVGIVYFDIIKIDKPIPLIQEKI